MKGIAGYTAQLKNGYVLAERSYAGVTDSIYTKDFNALSGWLTEQYPNTLHVVWDLGQFSYTVFSLLPQATLHELHTKTRAYHGNTKIFSVDRWLGLTHTKPLQGNIVQRLENNFFGLSHWMPPETDPPKDVAQVAEYGEQVLAGLERMGIQPTKLTSPVGVLSNELSKYNLPTIYSNPDIIDACEYCIPMMRHEWRSAFKLGFFPQVYSYDVVAAYPSIIAHLPDTDHCRIAYSDTYIHSDWAIVYGEVEVWADISPIVFNTGDGYVNPKGKWTGHFTKEEINWLLKHNAGTFTLKDGYFINWLSPSRPYRKPITRLFALRQPDNAMVDNLARRAAQGISGKLDQDNQDGSLGELYNPIYAAMTRSRCRLALADFIYGNDLLNDVVCVQVDGLDSIKEAHVADSGKMGTWRLDSEGPALVAGKGEIWKPGKKPLNISYEEITEAMRSHPHKSSYSFDSRCFDLLMARTELDRKYKDYPSTGGDLLGGVVESEPLDIGTLTTPM